MTANQRARPLEGAVFRGIYASTICAMGPDGRVDAAAVGALTTELAARADLAGFLVNGHAGENAQIDRSEARAVIAATRAAAPALRIVAGVNAEHSLQAARMAVDAAEAGADAVLIFAPYSWALHGDPDTIMAHHQIIHDATDLPVVLFQGSVRSGGMHFPPEVMARLVALPRVIGIKEGSWETMAYETTRQVVHEIRPDVAVMASGDEHLLGCFLLGSEGSLVSLAGLIPEAIVALDRAVLAGDFDSALALHRVITPLARIIYRPGPSGAVSARLKAGLVMRGWLQDATCRAPTLPVDAATRRSIDQALQRVMAQSEPGASTRAAGRQPRHAG